MRCIWIGRTGSHTIEVNMPLLVAALVLLLVVPLWLGWLLGSNSDLRPRHYFARIAASQSADISSQREQLAAMRQQMQRTLDAFYAQSAGMQVRLTHLEALGDAIAGDMGLDGFNFDDAPAMGGPAVTAESGAGAIDESVLMAQMDSMESRLLARNSQIQMLGDLMNDRRQQTRNRISGMPVHSGRISSGYGYRTDPFNGRRAWHKGIDIASRNKGAEVLAVANGVVTKTDKKGNSGYGKMVEIVHSNGYRTRYGHNERIHVQVGELVAKGQVIADVGSTGRATAPHVHFEVLKRNGRSVDPEPYIYKK